jgi:hypothetical protein
VSFCCQPFSPFALPFLAVPFLSLEAVDTANLIHLTHFDSTDTSYSTSPSSGAVAAIDLCRAKRPRLMPSKNGTYLQHICRMHRGDAGQFISFLA